MKRRFSHGLTLRGVYTWSKALDDGDSLNATAAANAVALLSNPYVPRADWGLATYDVRNLGVVTATYELPFGEGSRYLSELRAASGNVVGGWTLNSIVTAQSGFPFTPQLSYNPSNNGDTRNPVRAVSQSGVYGPGGPRKSESVVQSQRFHRAAEQQRIFWERRTGYVSRARALRHGIFPC